MKPDAASLERLHDIVAPAAVPWWPPAPGWYWVLGFLFVVAAVLLVRCFLRWQHNRYRREALAELTLHERTFGDPAGRATALCAAAELLKRVALTAFPRKHVATLTGRAWFDFLDRNAQGTSFAQGPGTILESATYDPRAVAKIDDERFGEALRMVRNWIKHHRRGPEQKTVSAPAVQDHVSSTALTS